MCSHTASHTAFSIGLHTAALMGSHTAFPISWHTTPHTGFPKDLHKASYTATMIGSHTVPHTAFQISSFHIHHLSQLPPPIRLEPPTFRLWDLHAPITPLYQFLWLDMIQSISSIKKPAVIAQLAKCVGPEEFCLTQMIAGSNSMLPQCFVAIVRDIF